jgi:hypothetical protein
MLSYTRLNNKYPASGWRIHDHMTKPRQSLQQSLANRRDGSIVVIQSTSSSNMRHGTTIVSTHQGRRASDEGEVHYDVALRIEPCYSAVQEASLSRGRCRSLESEFGDDDLLAREALMGVGDVVLELLQRFTIPVKVDVVVVASSVARVQEGLQPVQTLASVGRRGNGWQAFVDSQGVDVLLVPGSGVSGRDALEIGLVEREDISPPLLLRSVRKFPNGGRSAVLGCLHTNEVHIRCLGRPPGLPVVHPRNLATASELGGRNGVVLVVPRPGKTTLGGRSNTSESDEGNSEGTHDE